MKTMIRLKFRTGFIVSGVLLAGACAVQPQYPIQPAPAVQPPPPPPPPAPPPPPPEGADDNSPKAAPSGVIESQPLGAAAPAATLRPSSASASSDRALLATPTYPRDRPPLTPVLSLPHEVQVQPFETVWDVAERVRTPIRALIDLNGLRPPYTLAAGTILKVPPPVVYTVAEGDTLFGVARRFSVDPRSLANLNDLTLEQRVRVGQRLALPSLVRDRGANGEAKGPRPDGIEASAQAQPATPGRPLSRPSSGAAEIAADRVGGDTVPQRPSPPTASEAEIASRGAGKFIWPVKGEILSDFGPKGRGQRNDGVNIAAAAGSSVKAAASGTVVYAGNSIPAFGNLVLVKHPGGWASLYGNLGKITVSNNAQVSQGQEVGTAGISGAVDRPQVHFELRYAEDPREKAKPYNPLALLPSS